MKNDKKNERGKNIELKVGGVEWYRKNITDKVNQIEDVWILEQINKFVVNMTEGD